MNKPILPRVLLGAALAFAGRPALADEPAAPAGQVADRAACVASHQKAQELKRKGQLVETQAELSICSSAGCPGAIISDCGQWISDLEQTTPSMVFDVRLDGRQTTDFKIFVDDKLVSDLSKAHQVNPGKHVVRVELAPFPSKEETVVLPEGQRMRLVAFEFKAQAAEPTPEAATPAPTPAPFVPTRPTPVVVYPLLVASAVGFGTFGVFALLGKSREDRLSDQCAPDCTDDDLAPMKRSYLIADISAGVGAAALITAGVVYLTRPTKIGSEAARGLSVGPASAKDPRSWAVSYRGSF